MTALERQQERDRNQRQLLEERRAASAALRRDIAAIMLRLRDGDETARDDLINRTLCLVEDRVTWFLGRWKNNNWREPIPPLEDAIQVGYCSLIEVCRELDPNNVEEVAQYLRKSIDNALFNELIRGHIAAGLKDGQMLLPLGIADPRSQGRRQSTVREDDAGNVYMCDSTIRDDEGLNVEVEVGILGHITRMTPGRTPQTLEHCPTSPALAELKEVLDLILNDDEKKMVVLFCDEFVKPTRRATAKFLRVSPTTAQRLCASIRKKYLQYLKKISRFRVTKFVFLCLIL